MVGTHTDLCRPGEAKCNRQKLDLLDEIDSLKQQLARNINNSNDELQRLRIEKDKLSHDNTDLAKKLELTRRQAGQYKAAVEQYKDKLRRAKASITEWQEFADKHSPSKKGATNSDNHVSRKRPKTTAVLLTPLSTSGTGERHSHQMLGGIRQYGRLKNLVGHNSRSREDAFRSIDLPTPTRSSELSLPPTPKDIIYMSRPGMEHQQRPNNHNGQSSNGNDLERSTGARHEGIMTTKIGAGEAAAVETRKPNAEQELPLQALLHPVEVYDKPLVQAGPPKPSSNENHPEALASSNLSTRLAIPSSQSTDEASNLEGDQSDMRPRVELGIESSSPIIVSERKLKRKRRQPAPIIKRRSAMDTESWLGGAATKPFLVKEEQDSNPHSLNPLSTLQQSETMDLDHVDGPIDTPRKRQRLERLRCSSRMDGLSQRMASSLGQDRATSVPLAMFHPEHHDAHQEAPERASRSFDGMEMQGEGFDTAVEFPQRDRHTEPLGDASAQDLPLQSVSQNKQNVKASKTRARNCRRQVGTRRDKALEELVEDGESLIAKGPIAAKSAGHTAIDASGSSKVQKAHGERIHTLLEISSSPDKNDLTTPGPGKLKRPSHAQLTTQTDRMLVGDAATTLRTPQPPTIQHKLKTPITAPHPLRRPILSPPKMSTRRPRSSKTDRTLNAQELLARPPSLSPSHEPLAARPMHRLSLQDFKVNPRFNEGQKYAYNETVRRAADKACLPGCTDPRCCGGQFRRMIELGIAPSHGPSTHSLHPSGTETDADLKLLEEHLGGGMFARQHIDSMDATQRANAIVGAKAAEIAQKFGKHRQRNERRKTPPGFWDVEFPDSQKLEGHKDAVRKLERATVEARYKEAMRDDRKGRWLFRDE